MSASSSPSFEPGLLKLDLVANSRLLSPNMRTQGLCKIDQIKDELSRCKNRPIHLALQNYLAILLYRLVDEKAAVDLLKKTVKEDPDNLNALQDLVTIYNYLVRKKDANECEKKVKRVLGREVGADDSTPNKQALSRSLAGQALAWGFDLHKDTKGTKRLTESVELYEKAFETADGELKVEEREDWQYYLTLDIVRLNNIKRIQENRTHYSETLEKAVINLKPNLKAEDKERKSSSWCLLGNLFSQRPHQFNDQVPQVIAEEFLEFWKNPEKCYLLSLEFNRDNYIALNQLARLYFYDKKEEKAIDLLNRSIQINKDACNWFAFRSRAKIYRLRFNRQLKEKENSGEEPDKNLLLIAMDDLLLSIKYNPYVLDMINLAEVYHKLAWNPNGHNSDQLYDALYWCKKAVECQDGALRSDLHQRRALILRDLGDEESQDASVKCFMQAMDCENPDTNYNRNFLFMYKGMVQRYAVSVDKPKHLLQELVYWWEQGMKKYAHTKIKPMYFIKSHPDEMLSVVQGLIDSGKKKLVEMAQVLVLTYQDGKVACTPEKMKRATEAITTFLEKEKSKEVQSVESSIRNAFEESKEEGKAPDSIPSRDAVSDTFEECKEEGKAPDSMPSRDALSADASCAGNDKVATTTKEISGLKLDTKSAKEQSPESAVKKTRNSEGQNMLKPLDLPLPSIPAGKDLATPTAVTQSVLRAPSASAPCTPGERTVLEIIVDDEGSVTIQCSPEGGEAKPKYYRTTCKRKLSYKNLADAFYNVLLETDLRIDDISDPPEQAAHSDYTYDFYAIYDSDCEATMNWVYYHLRPQLEEGDPPLKGCIPERDFLAGKQILENISNALKQSAKILLIISNEFFKNNWCNSATNLAQHPLFQGRVIPVKVDKDVELPLSLQIIQGIDATNAIDWVWLRKQLAPTIA